MTNVEIGSTGWMKLTVEREVNSRPDSEAGGAVWVENVGYVSYECRSVLGDRVVWKIDILDPGAKIRGWFCAWCAEQEEPGSANKWDGQGYTGGSCHMHVRVNTSRVKQAV